MPDAVESISISHFKANCVAVLERVRRTGRPIRVIQRGKAIADVVAPPPAARPDPWIGSLVGRARIVGDIITLADKPPDWEALGG